MKALVVWRPYPSQNVFVFGFTDVNECVDNYDLCAYRCVNTPGSYKCVCPRGFELAPNKRHCRGKGQFKIVKNVVDRPAQSPSLPLE